MRNAINTDEKEIMIEDEDEWQNRRADVVHEALQSRSDRVGTGYSRSGERRQADWRGIVRQYPKIEAKKVRSHERNDNPVGLT